MLSGGGELSPLPRGLGVPAWQAPSHLPGWKGWGLSPSLTRHRPVCLAPEAPFSDSLPTLPCTPSSGLRGGLCPVLLHSSAPCVCPPGLLGALGWSREACVSVGMGSCWQTGGGWAKDTGAAGVGGWLGSVFALQGVGGFTPHAFSTPAIFPPHRIHSSQRGNRFIVLCLIMKMTHDCFCKEFRPHGRAQR